MYLASLVAASVVFQAPVVPAHLSALELEVLEAPQGVWAPQDAQELVLDLHQVSSA